jgi:hypothetical protein
MKHDRKPSRKASSLSETCGRLLNMYAIAAGAAGVGVLALAQPSEAEVVYTPAHAALARHGHLFLDLNNDGKIDFEIAQRSGCTTGGEQTGGRGAAGQPPPQFGGFCTAAIYLNVPFYSRRTHDNAAIGNGTGFPPHRAYALKSGAPISSAQPFGGFYLNFRNRASNSVGSCLASWGSWINVKDRYLGLKFNINGEFHFGWARLNVTCSPTSKVIALLTGYAYETVANTPIVAGQSSDSPRESRLLPENGSAAKLQPATLGVLALGSLGLEVWRKRETGIAS